MRPAQEADSPTSIRSELPSRLGRDGNRLPMRGAEEFGPGERRRTRGSTAMETPTNTLAAAASTTQLKGAAGKGTKVSLRTYPSTAAPTVKIAKGTIRRPWRQTQTMAARTVSR